MRQLAAVVLPVVMEKHTMSTSLLFRQVRGALLRLAAALLCTLGVSAALAAGPQRVFATPEAALSALVQAVRADDSAAVLSIIGESAKPWLSSGDAVDDRSARKRFVQRYDEKHAVAVAKGKASVSLGADDWPFAFPLVKSSAGWRFDTEAGKKELLARRIGGNELAVVNVMLAIVDAQREYAAADRDGSGLPQYAMRFASSEGRRDGLYWKTAPGEPDSPLGPLVTRAAAEGYTATEGAQPFHGYMFRLLRSQGPNAKGGAFDYIVRGRMIGGFAAIAYPAKYGNSGVMTFIVNHDGVVYERDLGPDTAARAASITMFDPGAGWSPVKSD
jgi:hypothetical protein